MEPLEPAQVHDVLLSLCEIDWALVVVLPGSLVPPSVRKEANICLRVSCCSGEKRSLWAS